MAKVALVAFQGEPMCFVHVMLNGLDLQQRGVEAVIILEGQATALAATLQDAGHPFHSLYERTKAAGLIAGVCRACATKMGALEAAQVQGLTLLDDMQGHPALGRYLEAGYAIWTF
jgi:hypothetical protein